MRYKIFSNDDEKEPIWTDKHLEELFNDFYLIPKKNRTMKYDLVQYGCNVCGELTDVLDVDQPLPKGWVVVSRLSHLCPTCAKHIKETNFYPENYYDIDIIIEDVKQSMRGELEQ